MNSEMQRAAHQFEPTPPARQPGFERRDAKPRSTLPQGLRSALEQILLQAEAAETRWARLATGAQAGGAGLSSLQKLSELMDERILAARNDREALILPLAAKVDRRRTQIRVVRLLLSRFVLERGGGAFLARVRLAAGCAKLSRVCWSSEGKPSWWPGA